MKSLWTNEFRVAAEPEIRRARLSDAKTLYELSRPSMPDSIVYREIPVYRRLIRQFRVCEVAGVVAGCVGVHRMGDIAELYNVCVAEGWRGWGIGRLLVESSIRTVRSEGITEIVLFSRSKVSWFTALGFEPADESVLPFRRRRMIDRARGSTLLRLAVSATGSTPAEAPVARIGPGV